MDRAKQGTKRSLIAEANGTPIGCVVAGANRHDCPLPAPALERLSRSGFDLPERITAHLDAGYDSRATRELLKTLGCDHVISTKGAPLQAGGRWVIERTSSWHNRGFHKPAICTERRIRAINALTALANAITITRRLIHHAWTTHRWDTRPTRQP